MARVFKKAFKKFKKKSLYSKSLLIFILILIVLFILCLSYVYNSLVTYEKNMPENYIKNITSNKVFIKEVSKVKIPESEFDKDNDVEKAVKSFLKSDKTVIKENKKNSTDKVSAYDIYYGKSLLFTANLKIKKSYTKIGLLKINEYDLDSVKFNLDKGLYNYEISIPESYKLFINNTEVNAKYVKSTSDDKELSELTAYIKINPMKVYSIENLINEPRITIKDDAGKEVKFEIKNNKIEIKKEYKEIAKYEDAKQYIKGNFDVLAFAETWSKFLTRDLTGTRHGFDQYISPYLISDSKMYKVAYGWATGVDITFTSAHRLKNPPFVNEKVENCVIYNENAFSCEVSLEKHMILTRSGETKIDNMHDRFFFIYKNGSYKFVDNISLSEETD